MTPDVAIGNRRGRDLETVYVLAHRTGQEIGR